MGIFRPQANMRELIEASLSDVMLLMNERFAAVGQPHPKSPLGQGSLANGDEVVLDYLKHNETGVALDHLLYMISEADLPITTATFNRITQAGETMGMDSAKWARVNPNLDPISSVAELRETVHGCYSISIKRLASRHGESHQQDGPFAGQFLDWQPVSDFEEFLATVLALQPAEQMRCHMPVYSIEFHSPTSPTVEFAPCFKCSNAKTRIGNSFGWLKFDGKAAAAVELLEWLKTIEADAATGPNS